MTASHLLSAEWDLVTLTHLGVDAMLSCLLIRRVRPRDTHTLQSHIYATDNCLVRNGNITPSETTWHSHTWTRAARLMIVLCRMAISRPLRMHREPSRRVNVMLSCLPSGSEETPQSSTKERRSTHSSECPHALRHSVHQNRIRQQSGAVYVCVVLLCLLQYTFLSRSTHFIELWSLAVQQCGACVPSLMAHHRSWYFSRLWWPYPRQASSPATDS